MFDLREVEPESLRGLKRSEFPNPSYQKEHPTGALLAIEVAWSSLPKNRKIKRPLYAASGVLEYWIVNVEEQRIEVYADSDGERYLSEASYGLGERVSLRAFPDVTIAVADVFA